MRATISFETDVSRVNDIMRSLVLEESNALQDAVIALEKATADRIVEGISDALAHLYGVARQLEQYQQMMVSFEQARFQTMVPQPADTPMTVSASTQVKDDPLNETRFNSFLDRINMENDDAKAEEG